MPFKMTKRKLKQILFLYEMKSKKSSIDNCVRSVYTAQDFNFKRIFLLLLRKWSFFKLKRERHSLNRL